MFNSYKRCARKPQTVWGGALLYVLTLLLFTSCGTPNATGSSSFTTQTTQIPPPVNAIHGIVSQLAMINTRIGWAQSMHFETDGTHVDILRTVDGGARWQIVFTCLPRSSDGGKAAEFTVCTSDFRSASIATVLEPLQNNQSRIYHTSDGGRTWQSSVINARALQTNPVFVDGQHGWFFATDHFPGPDPSSSYIGQFIALYRTSDGGRSWQRIGSGPATSQLPVTSDDGYGTVPPFTANTRMTFLNATTGWLTGSIYKTDGTDDAFFYTTHDAGSTWQRFALSIPAQSLNLWVPQFFDEKNGLMPVLVSGPATTQQTAIYTTHDGGQTWSQSALVPFDVTGSTWLSMDVAWSSSNNTENKTFFITCDGWKHWTKHQIKTTFKQIYGFTFVSPQVGWALGENRIRFFPEPGGGRRTGDTISLLKTVDGGQTWQVIANAVV
jgi:photosystem II stability/assembly factor-like uncharacterized protein